MEMSGSKWAIVELMGHRQVAGKISEVTQYGVTMLRVEVPSISEPGKVFRTQDYGGSAIYCLTHCDEETAMRFVRQTGWEQQTQVIGLLGKPEHDDRHAPDDVCERCEREAVNCPGGTLTADYSGDPPQRIWLCDDCAGWGNEDDEDDEPSEYDATHAEGVEP